jgi:hypothetical protein
MLERPGGDMYGSATMRCMQGVLDWVADNWLTLATFAVAVAAHAEFKSIGTTDFV